MSNRKVLFPQSDMLTRAIGILGEANDPRYERTRCTLSMRLLTNCAEKIYTGMPSYQSSYACSSTFKVTFLPCPIQESRLMIYPGILFLTTNRVETFDDAFQSRIHVALRYGELTMKAKRAVWKMFIGKVKEIAGVEIAVFKESDFDKLAKHTLNGRQVGSPFPLRWGRQHC